MRFSESVWQQNLALYQSTLHLPFNQELAAGTLSKDAFCHYIIQDAHYLIAYGRSLAVCAAKAFSAEEIIQFSEAAKLAIVFEREMHHGFLDQFQVSTQDLASTPLSLACHHYTSYLLATAWAESYPVVLASLLPCFWIYAEVGKDIVHQSAPNNPYQAWIDTYAGEDFHEAVQKVIDTVDNIAARVDEDTLEKMHEAYRKAAQLEWLFWDSAYKQARWPGLDNL